MDGLTKTEVAFMEQVGFDGKPIGIMPSILLVPPALSAVAAQLNKSLDRDGRCGLQSARHRVRCRASLRCPMGTSGNQARMCADAVGGKLAVTPSRTRFSNAPPSVGWCAGRIPCGVPGMSNSEFVQFMDVSMETTRHRAVQVMDLVTF